MREAVKVSNDRPCCSTASCQRHRVRCGCVRLRGCHLHRWRDGAHRTAGCLGDSACSLPRTTCRSRPSTRSSARLQAMARPECGGLMNVQFAIQEVDVDVIYVLEVNPAPRARCRSFPRPRASSWPRWRHVAWWAHPGLGITKGSHTAIFQREGGRVPRSSSSRRGHHPRPEMKVHRRSDGRGQTFGKPSSRARGRDQAAGPPGKGSHGENSDKPRAVDIARQLVAGLLNWWPRGYCSRDCRGGVPVAVVNKVTEGRPHRGHDQEQRDWPWSSTRWKSVATRLWIRARSVLVAAGPPVTTFTTIFGAEAAVEGMKVPGQTRRVFGAGTARPAGSLTGFSRWLLPPQTRHNRR